MLNQTYSPPFVFRHAHINTIFPSLFRKLEDPKYLRRTIDTYDGDFLDIDTKLQSSSKVAILCHGLEGSSQSKYMIATANLLFEKGWDVLAINYRGCSGRINNGLEMYHAGRTDDLDCLIQKLCVDYETISIIGYSLGGNMVLKYCGDNIYDLDPRIKSVVSVSSPLDLAGGGIEIGKFKNRIYDNRFVKELKIKMRLKAIQFPDKIDLKKLKKIKRLFDFDDQFTAPLHGFKNAKEYYNINHAKQFLKNLSIPTLIIQAKDDPFLSDSCYPVEIAASNPFIHLLMPEYGGHLGFYNRNSTYYWDELMIESFIGSYLK